MSSCRHPCAILAGQNRAGAGLAGTSVIPSALSDAFCTGVCISNAVVKKNRACCGIISDGFNQNQIKTVQSHWMCVSFPEGSAIKAILSKSAVIQDILCGSFVLCPPQCLSVGWSSQTGVFVQPRRPRGGCEWSAAPGCGGGLLLHQQVHKKGGKLD